jgi:hypothetical protein
MCLPQTQRFAGEPLQPFCNLFCNPYRFEYNIVTRKVAEKQKKNKLLSESFSIDMEPYEQRYIFGFNLH